MRYSEFSTIMEDDGGAVSTTSGDVATFVQAVGAKPAKKGKKTKQKVVVISRPPLYK